MPLLCDYEVELLIVNTIIVKTKIESYQYVYLRIPRQPT